MSYILPLGLNGVGTHPSWSVVDQQGSISSWRHKIDGGGALQCHTRCDSNEELSGRVLVMKSYAGMSARPDSNGNEVRVQFPGSRALEVRGPDSDLVSAWEYIMALTLMGVRHLISPRWLEKM